MNKNETDALGDEDLYAIAFAEVDSKEVNRGLWAKAFAETDGDEVKAKALYIRLRVQQEKNGRTTQSIATRVAAEESARRLASENRKQYQHALSEVHAKLIGLGYQVSERGSGWSVREPLGARITLKSDSDLIEYATGRVQIPQGVLERSKAHDNEPKAASSHKKEMASPVAAKSGHKSQSEEECGQGVSAIINKSAAPSQMPSGQSGAIWNPNAASNWSLIFSPAFGSYLHALNWRTLGETEKEKSSMGWFYFSLAMFAVYLSTGLFMADPEKADGAARGLGLLYLLVWYFSAGRAQAKYVKEKFGSTYPRRPWGKPLLIGVAALVGFFVVAIAVGLIVGSVSA